MKRIPIILFSLLFALSPLMADIQLDYNFQQERMRLSPDSVIVISSFENQDVISAYTYQGLPLWDSRFHAKILSWDMAGDYIFVFSKDRRGHKTYLTCLNRYTGGLIWQKP